MVNEVALALGLGLTVAIAPSLSALVDVIAEALAGSRV
jgi:hypothetical protein